MHLSRRAKAAALIPILTLVLLSGVVYAEQTLNPPRKFVVTQQFELTDPAQPNIWVSVNGQFINTDVPIVVNMSANDGVAQLTGTFSLIIQLYNDTSGQYDNVTTLATDQPVTLTPTVQTFTFSFDTTTPGYYNAVVEFTATSVTLA